MMILVDHRLYYRIPPLSFPKTLEHDLDCSDRAGPRRNLSQANPSYLKRTNTDKKQIFNHRESSVPPSPPSWQLLASAKQNGSLAENVCHSKDLQIARRTKRVHCTC